LAEKRRKEQQESLQLKKEQEEQKKLDGAIQSRGIKSEKKNVTEEDDFRPTAAIDQRVYLDAENRLHWPVFFIYPEYQQTDFIADFNEEDRLIDHLATVFEETPPWDAENKYSNLANLGVYFEARTKEGKTVLAKVNPELSLKKIITHPNYVVYDRTPGLIIIVKGSSFEKQFIEKYKNKAK